MRVRIWVAVMVAAATVGCPRIELVSLNAIRNAVLPDYFNEAALDAIGGVPMYEGNLGPGGGCGGLAVGDDWGSRALSAALGNGHRRQVIISCPNPDEYLVLHEYAHQADYEGLISRELWAERFARMETDPNPAYRAAAAYINGIFDLLREYPSQAIALRYDDGMLREGIAYTIDSWAAGIIELPDYMWEVYSDAIRADVFRGKREEGAAVPYHHTAEGLCVSGFHVKE